MDITFSPDGFDLSQLRDTTDSPGYALLTRRYQAIIDNTRDALERCRPEEVIKLQTRIETLRTVLEIPAIVAASIKTRRERGLKR